MRAVPWGAMDVSVLGIPAEAEEVYRYFLRHPEDGVGSARQALGTLALLDISDRHRVVATDPRIGFERLIEERLSILNTEIRRVLAAREAIASFQEDQWSGENSARVLDIKR